MNIKELAKKIGEDKKLMGIVLAGILLIIVLGVMFIKSGGEADENRFAENEVDVIGDLDIPSDGEYDHEADDPNKTDVYDDYRKRNDINNVDNMDDMFVFSDEDLDTSSMSEDEYDKLIADQAQSLRDKYNKQTNRYDVAGDFTRTNTNKSSGSSGGNNSTSNNDVVPDEPVNVEPERRRKNVGSGGGNMTISVGDQSAGSSSMVEARVYNRGRAVTQGSSMRFKLNEDLILNGVTIPKDHIITGIVSFGNERVKIKFTSIRLGNDIHKVTLIAFGEDGQEGIYTQNVISHDVAEENINSAISNGSSNVTIPILGDVSVDLARAKIRDQSVSVEDGTMVLLKIGK